MPFRSGRHFLQLPGPTNVPDRILRAMSKPTIDHRGPEFKDFGAKILEELRDVFQASEYVFVCPASGSGSWEAGLINTLAAGDKVLRFDAGYFSQIWGVVATRLGLDVQVEPWDWRLPVDPEVVAGLLRADVNQEIKAVLIVHNETATGVVTDIPAIRKAIDETGHPVLLMVDSVSSACAMEYRHDDWGVDVTICGSQKGFMLPPGLSFCAVSKKALEVHRNVPGPRSYWDWTDQLTFEETGYFPYTPATNLLYGLEEALKMLREEGLENTYARHARLGEATRRAVAAWGLENFCNDPSAVSSAATSVLMPEGSDANLVRTICLEKFDMSLGGGLGQIDGKVFRIGHLGDVNDLMICGTLSGVEMALGIAGVPHKSGGVVAALEYLARN